MADDPYLAFADPIAPEAASSPAPATVAMPSPQDRRAAPPPPPQAPQAGATPDPYAAFADPVEAPADAHPSEEEGLTGETTDDSPAHPDPEAERAKLEPSTPLDALGRGAADFFTFGTLPKLNALGNAGHDWITGEDGFSDSYHRHLDENNAIVAQDEAVHPYYRLGGQLLGSVVLPFGDTEAALQAGKAVLRAGGTMADARKAALAAAAVNQAKIGATLGAAHGVGSADNLHDAVTQGALGAVEGGVAGFGVTKLGQTAASAAEDLANGPVGALAQRINGAGPDVAGLARDIGVHATPATLGPVGRIIQKGFAQLPGADAVVGKANAREVTDLAAATDRVADSLGTATNRDAAGGDVAGGASQWAQAQDDTAEELYKTRNRLMGGDDAPLPTPLTAKALADLKARYPNSPAMVDLMTHPAVRQIEAALPDAPSTAASPILKADGTPFTNTVTPPSLNLDEATTALSYIRRAERRLDANPDVDPDLARGVSNVKQALNADLRTAAAKADKLAGRDPLADGSALASHNAADQTYAGMMGATKRGGALNRAVSSADDPIKVSAESVYNQLSNDMLAKSGNLARLRDMFFRLPQDAKGSFAATKISELGGPGPEWSFNKFVTNWNAMSPQARNIVFGTEANKSLDKIFQYARQLQQTEKGRNFSNTASGMFAGAYNGAIIGSIMKGEPAEAAMAAATAPVFAGAAKLFVSTPAMRNWTASVLKTMANKVMPDGVREKSLQSATGRLSAIAAGNPTIAGQVHALQQHLWQAANDNAHLLTKSAASGGGQTNGDQKD